MIIYRISRSIPFTGMVIANWDGSCRKLFYFGVPGFLDACWFNEGTCLMYIHESGGQYLYTDGQPTPLSDGWMKEGNYLVQLDDQNQISSIKPY